ncbi:penicillin-binding protein [Cryobacterium psychrophilum]|uniref:PASTA domain-containing protein n=1 Tax=Cryobacterium psychrophilum TaxID=41988 RepID=A0A4Y8KVG5_9MICO|nr:penicillin-binding protein [Cryobacterium psychrophilum]TDW29810.1 membrane peptidoglycan carboxypeptidase [Cryobacterium psychrophilum]TFD80175.1 PASTA domain-containing protein [Cryobacterium psychrophilum]
MRDKSTGRKRGRKSIALLGFIAMSAAVGVLAAIGVTPVLALSGLSAGTAITAFDSLPGSLEIGRLSQRSNIYAKQADGSPVLLASFYDQNRVEVASHQISQFVKDAAVAGEDPRFYEHNGVDIQGTIRAVLKTATGSATQGGSSITQQYVKNVLVQKCELIANKSDSEACYVAATETTAGRKLEEMRLAIGVEKKYEKSDILRQYLNIIGFGGAVYGIEAAARHYFDTSAADLTLPQAASLVAIVNNPVKFQLDKPNSESNGAAGGYAANKSRRDYILGEMLVHDKIGIAQYDDAVATVITPTITQPSTGCQAAGANAFFCDYVVKELQNDPAFGEDADSRLVNFGRGGYDVYTTLDLDLQNAAVTTMAENVPQSYPGGDVGGVISSVQVGTGRVLAMAQNKTYSQNPDVASRGASATAINYNTDFAHGGSSGFQPGSTYKVFTLAEWLSAGHALRERVDSSRTSNWGTFQDSCRGPQRYPGWNPRNDSSGENNPHYSALESTISSINTGFIGMAKELDLCAIRKTAEKFDVHRADGDPLRQSAATVIGTNEIAPLTMAAAFAGIANSGTTCSPVAIDTVTGPNGDEIPLSHSDCSESVTPKVAAGMTYAMHRVMTSGTARQSYAATSPRVPMIAKTGTTDGSQDTWMSGASSNVATVVGVVSVTGEINQRRVSFDSGSAATARHRMWPDVMSVANAKYGGDAFATPNRSMIYGAKATVPDLVGLSLADAETALGSAGFTLSDGGTTASDAPQGTVVSFSPGRAYPGSTITVRTSEGPIPTEKPHAPKPTKTPKPTSTPSPTASPLPLPPL